jgi:DNA-binding CsgD family transcriptional regulator
MSAQSGRAPHGTEGFELDGGDGLPGESEFFNRTRELEQLRLALHGLRRGLPARQLIQGEGGIGKSRLLAEAISGAEQRDVAIYTGRAGDFERDRPFGILVDALGLHTHSGDATAAAIGRLVLRARYPGRPEERHDLIPRIVRLIDRLCRTQPVALVLEDMQWADPMSAVAVLRTLEELADRPLGVFMTQRALPMNPALDDLIERARPEFERIALDGLESQDVGSLVRSMTGGEPGPQLARLLAGAAGNPSMVITVIKGLREKHVLWLTGGVAETDATLPPRSMWPRVMARIARHSDTCQDLLTLAAVFGGRIAVATLATAADRSVFDVLTDLRGAIAGGILTEVDGVLCFRHELVRLILFEETPPSLRSELQRRIAEVLPPATWSPGSAGPGPMLEGARGAAEVELSGAPQGWERATRAEREVVRHVVHGLSNREIGKLLFVSARTVETHLGHVYSKLGVSSRVELTGVVMRNPILRAGLAEESQASFRGKGHDGSRRRLIDRPV